MHDTTTSTEILIYRGVTAKTIFLFEYKKSFSRENVWDNKRCFYKAFHSLRHQRKSGKEVSVGVLTKASSQR